MEGDADIFTKFFNALKESVAEISLIPAPTKELHLQRWLANFCALRPTFNMAVTDFLSKIFSDKRCWCDGGLVGKTLGECLISEPDNPLNFRIRYHMACRYCLEEQIPKLFIRWLNDCVIKWVFPSELYVKFERSSPIENYWTSLIKGEELTPYNPEYGFQRALQIDWPEGVEYFYQKCDGLLKNKLLSKCLHNILTSNTKTLDFCLSNINLHNNFIKNPMQRRSFLKLLIDKKQQDTFIHIFNSLEPKTISQNEYISYLCLSSKNIQWDILSHLWNHNSYVQHRNINFDDKRMCRALVELICNFERDDKNEYKQKIITDIMKFVKNQDEIKNQFIYKIAITRGITKECFVRSIHILEKFFNTCKCDKNAN